MPSKAISQRFSATDVLFGKSMNSKIVLTLKMRVLTWYILFRNSVFGRLTLYQPNFRIAASVQSSRPAASAWCHGRGVRAQDGQPVLLYHLRRQSVSLRIGYLGFYRVVFLNNFKHLFLGLFSWLLILRRRRTSGLKILFKPFNRPESNRMMLRG